MSWAAILTALPIILGCNDRAVDIAREGADRQAKQNETMAVLQREVAEGSRKLVEEEGAARRQALQLQQDVQSERKSLAAGWDDLEAARQANSATRRSDEILAVTLQGVIAALVGVLALAFAYLTMYGLRDAKAATEVSDLMLAQLFIASNSPWLVGGGTVSDSLTHEDASQRHLPPPRIGGGEPEGQAGSPQP